MQLYKCTCCGAYCVSTQDHDILECRHNRRTDPQTPPCHICKEPADAGEDEARRPICGLCFEETTCDFTY